MDALTTPFTVASWTSTPGHVVLAILIFGVSLLLGPRVGRWIEGHVESTVAQLTGLVARRLVQALGLLLALDTIDVLTVRQVATWMSDVMDVHLFDLGDKPVTLGTVAMVLLFFVGSLVVSGRIQQWLAALLARQGMKSEGPVAVGTRFVHYLTVVVGLGIGLQTAGVDLTSVFTAGAVFAIGIGFAVQNLTQNFVSGIILLMEGAIRPGDVLLVDGAIVRVSQMNLRATVVRNLDDAEIILPNSTLVASAVTNLTMTNRSTRIRVPVGVVYAADPREVVRVLHAAAEAFLDRSEEEPVVLFRDYGSSSLDFEVSVWTQEPWRTPRIASALRMDMWYALKHAGIVIAFPQLDVHLDDEVVKRLGAA